MSSGTGLLRVLQVCPRFPPDLGGIETHVAEICRRGPRDRGLRLSVLATDRTGRLPADERTDEGVDVRRVPAHPRTRDYYLAPRLVPAIRRGGWDLVHVQGIHTAVPVLAMAAALAARIPYVVTFHTGGHSSPLRSRARTAQWKALAPLLRRAERLVAVSRFERDLFLAATGIPAQRFALIRNGGGLPRPAEPIRTVPGRIVSSGRLEWYKGHHRAIDALAVLRRTRADAHLEILGSGPIEAQLRERAARLGVQDAVTIRCVPPTDRTGMAQALGAANALAAFSEYEAHPVAVMEALALDVPVVGTAVAGIGDLVEDGLVTGLPADADPVAAAAALATAMSAGPGTPPQQLPTWDEAADALFRLYHDAAARRVPPATAPEQALETHA